LVVVVAWVGVVVIALLSLHLLLAALVAVHQLVLRLTAVAEVLVAVAVAIKLTKNLAVQGLLVKVITVGITATQQIITLVRVTSCCIPVAVVVPVQQGVIVVALGHLAP
jgi:hypothetical protein